MGKTLVRFDWAMKRLLRDKANYVVLEGFLSELLKFDLKIDLIGESEGNQQNETDKFNRVDILAHTASNEIILIELQIDSEIDYFHRMLYGVSKAISEHIKLGEAYEKIKKVYSINIVYFQLGQGEDYVYHGKNEFRGIHKNDLLSLNHQQKEKYTLHHVHEIYPEYYIIKINDFNDVAKDGLDEWIYFLKNNEIKDSFKAKGLKEAQGTLAYDKMNKTEKIAYQHHLENSMYTASMLESAKFEGKLEGKLEGKREGKREGKLEEKMDIAKNLLKLGLSIADISKATGLTENEIKEI
jgi:predicted transposase/invertase (TIGR01784 family)